MKLVCLALFTLLVGCQDLNSNSSDREKYGPTSLIGSDNFREAYPILVKRCGNCHTSNIHAAWASYQNEQTWIDLNKIVPSDSRNSQIIIRTINTGGNNANMPQGGSAIPDQEYETLIRWIDNL